MSVCPLAAENKVLVWLYRSGVQRTLLVSLPMDVRRQSLRKGSPSSSSPARAQPAAPVLAPGAITCLCAGKSNSLPHLRARHGSVVNRAAGRIRHNGYTYVNLDQTRSAAHGGVNMVASKPVHAGLRMLCRPPPALLVRSSLNTAAGRSSPRQSWASSSSCRIAPRSRRIEPFPRCAVHTRIASRSTEIACQRLSFWFLPVRTCNAAPHCLRLYEQLGRMGYLNGAAPEPLRLLDTTMSGYVLGLAIAAVLPALRLALDRALLSVLPPSISVRLAPAV